METQIIKWLEHFAPYIKQKRNFMHSLKTTRQGMILMNNGYLIGEIKQETFVPNPRAHYDLLFDSEICKFW